MGKDEHQDFSRRGVEARRGRNTGKGVAIRPIVPPKNDPQRHANSLKASVVPHFSPLRSPRLRVRPSSFFPEVSHAC